MCSNCNNNLSGLNSGNYINPSSNMGVFIDNTNTNPNLGLYNNESPVSLLNNNANNSCGCNSPCNCNSCGCSNNTYSCNCNGNNTATAGNNTTSNILQENLRNFIGRRCTCEFNICGTCFKRTGVLTCVGNNFITLAGVNNNNCLLCDTAGLTFVTVHNC